MNTYVFMLIVLCIVFIIQWNLVYQSFQDKGRVDDNVMLWYFNNNHHGNRTVYRTKASAGEHHQHEYSINNDPNLQRNGSATSITSNSASRRHGSNRTAAMCIMVKDEERYLKEWILYHLGLGFDHVYIYDNSNVTNKVQTWLKQQQLSYLNEKTTIHPFHNKYVKSRQVMANMNCVKKHKDKYTWIAFFDVDEFLVLYKHETVVELLEEHLCCNGSLGINWINFGTSNHTSSSSMPVTQRFLYSYEKPGHIKTIVYTPDFISMRSPHWAALRDNDQRWDTDGNFIRGQYNKDAGVHNPTFHPNGPMDVAVLHHYRVKSLEEYNWKTCARGRAWHDKRDGNFLTKRCQNTTLQLSDLPSGQTYDDSAWKLYQKNVLSLDKAAK